jgi:rod shape-determining protein MreC
MQYSPPPLFKQGASARAKVVFFAFFAVFLLVVDSRMQTLRLARQVLGTILYPVQMLAVMPRDAVYGVGQYFASVAALEGENARLKRDQALNADKLQQNTQLSAENAHLRKLLDTRERMQSKSLLAEILYDVRGSARKIIVNRGSQHGVDLSQPVIDDLGVVGQVTRVYPLTSEITLLTDKNQAIPVMLARNGLRGVANGRGEPSYLDMNITANADIKVGDQLVTSGLDGVYPPGLAVAQVSQVENKANAPFETILCKPAAGISRNRQLLILLVETNKLPPPDTEDVRVKKEKLNRKVTRDSSKDAAEAATAKEPAKEAGKDGGKDAVKDTPKDAAKDGKAQDAAAPATSTEKKEGQ